MRGTGNLSWTCPKCGVAASLTVDSRPTDEGVRRLRLCLGCKATTPTLEIPVAQIVTQGRMRKMRRLLMEAAEILDATIKAGEASVPVVKQ